MEEDQLVLSQGSGVYVQNNMNLSTNKQDLMSKGLYNELVRTNEIVREVNEEIYYRHSKHTKSTHKLSKKEEIEKLINKYKNPKEEQSKINDYRSKLLKNLKPKKQKRTKSLKGKSSRKGSSKSKSKSKSTN